MNRPKPDAGDRCDGCSLSRRDAIARTLAGIATAFLSEGLAPRVAEALTASMTALGAGRPTRAGAKAYPVPAADGAQFASADELILLRYQGKVYAFALSCPHQNTALKWVADGDRFQCPKHKSKYLPDGTFLSGRATRNMDRYAITHSGSEVEVDLNVLYRNDKQPSEWAAAVVTV